MDSIKTVVSTPRKISNSVLYIWIGVLGVISVGLLIGTIVLALEYSNAVSPANARTKLFKSDVYSETVIVFNTPDCITDVVKQDKMWEDGMCREMADSVTSGSTFIDVGANLGFSTLGVWSFLKKPKNVHFVMVEMQSEAGSIAKFNTRNISQRIIYHCALADTAGDLIKYSLAPNNNGATQMQKLTANKGDSSRVPTLTMDSIVSPTHCSVMKVDIENEEATVFGPGADKFWARTHPTKLFVEIFNNVYDVVHPLICARGYRLDHHHGHDYVYVKI
jgi:FkbM family methyltransferase